MTERGVTLRQAMVGRQNNLNIVKLLAAIMVIVGHSYAFSRGYERYDWLYVLTDGRGDLGGLAVYIFFFYSGLLITQSMLRSNNTLEFWKRRFVRIYPAFLLVTLTITFVMAPFFTTLPFGAYFSNLETYRYLKNLIFITHHNLPGVFVNNIYGRAVNGPIWTIRVEVFCYFLCFIYGKLGLLKKEKLPISVILFGMIAGIFGFAAIRHIEGSLAVLIPITMFYVGMLYSVYADAIVLEMGRMVIATIGFIVGVIMHQVILVSIVFLPYILCYCAFKIKYLGEELRYLDHFGKCSYEIYLWGGFIGQVATYMCGGSMNEYLNMLITIPVTLILGVVTHWVIEK